MNYVPTVQLYYFVEIRIHSLTGARPKMFNHNHQNYLFLEKVLSE